MAHGVSEVLAESNSTTRMTTSKHNQAQNVRKTVGVMGSRRIFAPAFKLKVLDSYRNDIDCRGNQRATARKYGIHRRQIQKWLQCEDNLRSSCAEMVTSSSPVSSNSSSSSSSSSSASSTTLGSPAITEGAPTADAGSVAPLAPALNLSLARLHGDDVPPGPLATPPSPHYPQTSTSGYHQEYINQDQHGQDITYRSDEADKYYAMDGYDAKVCQSAQGYAMNQSNHQNHKDHQETHPSEHSHHHQYRDSHGSVLLARTIKSERASSPDSVATTGPYEALGPPCGPLGAVPCPHQENTSTRGATATPPPTCIVASPPGSVHSPGHACPMNSQKPSTFEPEEAGGLSSAYGPPGHVSCSRIYPGPGSPQGPHSSPPSPQGSARSSTSSDSELDPLDFSNQKQSADLARRRSFSLRFKLDVLDAFHRDVGVAGNQRATARKFGINRRQVQKWLSQETELRGEIALRGGTSRQRLGPSQDVGEVPVDLRIHCSMPESPTPYCCELSVPRTGYYTGNIVESPEVSYRTCILSCCTEGTTETCYQEMSITRPCYTSPQRIYCYSPRESVEIGILQENTEPVLSSPLKRSCTLSCCYEPSSPKKICLDSDDPPQDVPLCLVKPKRICDLELVTSTVPTPPTPTPAAKKDAILFKPYLDNPVSKPIDDDGQISPVPNNNNNCQGICNLNENRGHDYALELSLRVPVSWRTVQTPYTDYPQVRSAFVRYPTSPHYT
ncbi:uncharacterized protein LOC112494830 [Cephus cinctus]|uniref:Uncharacterized protein LOC112494830 n=1 Tax=Cephus cinctus TaxID=211228 RepID=A0AAJ7RN00_CEPCN|nr:uncharacterized protein LOC112494830 [Cephus cinctus]